NNNNNTADITFLFRDTAMVGMFKTLIDIIILIVTVVSSTCEAPSKHIDETLSSFRKPHELEPSTSNVRREKALIEPLSRRSDRSSHKETFCSSSCREAWTHNLYTFAFWNATKKVQFAKICTLHSHTFPLCNETQENINIVTTSNKAFNRDKIHNHLHSSRLSSMCSYSSVWCHSSPESGLRCRFQNLYYNLEKREFVFVYHFNSVLYGINSIKTLQDQLFMSSVVGHNAFQILITTVPFASFTTKYKCKTIPGKSLIMARFKSDNLLHVFHDDLLPTYFTVKEICMNDVTCSDNMTLIFTDENDRGMYWDLYQLMSKNVLLMSESNSVSKYVWYCFANAHIGLNKLSVWYQYGFGKPQGPQVSNTFSGYHLRQFTDFIKGKLKIEYHVTGIQLGVLISRKYNRKILNEEDLSAVIKDQLTLQGNQKDSEVTILSLEDKEFFTIISELTRARVAVGVHGAALILGMFLPPGSILVEIWPYGINPNAATVYKTLCELPNFGITYVPWMNEDLENTVYHPEYPSFYGGLSHLSFDKQQDIIKGLHENKLNAVECCDNTTWLFRMYQDTRVHTNENDTKYLSDPFSSILREGFSKSKDYLINEAVNNKIDCLLHPSKVQEVHCYLIKGSSYTKLFMEWEDPWNIEDINCQDIYFEVVVKIEGESAVVRDTLSNRHYFKKLKFGVESTYTWVTCFCNGTEGSVFFKMCTI
ncbi:hypothetical protein OTU49_008167, partial [Cherax quadricarinatus]